MHQRRIRRFFLPLVAVLTAAALVSPAVSAHVGARHHHHRQGRHVRAVIVVGNPKPASNVVVIGGVRHGTLDLNVKPRETEVYVDGKLRGTADAFDGFPDKLHLRPGTHRVKLVTPEGAEVARDIRVKAGVEYNVGLDLR